MRASSDRPPESPPCGAAIAIGRARTNAMRGREKPRKRALRDARLAAALRENLASGALAYVRACCSLDAAVVSELSVMRSLGEAPAGA